MDSEVLVHEPHADRTFPTAEATRLVESRRTSPTANTPGGVDSNGRRVRRSSDGPVMTNPQLSRATSGGSHWVYGSAPMSTKRGGGARVDCSGGGLPDVDGVEPSIARAP